MTYAVGSIIAGKYQVQRLLGQGGMGTVYLATHRLLERSVALKILRRDESGQSLSSERLLREGRALSRLRGPHIARVLDVEATENGPSFLVLEYLEGQDLARVLQSTGPQPIERAITYLLEACEALAEAHAIGIIHRDIKPSNLFLTALDDGSTGIKVIDFGIAKHQSTSTAITQSGSIVGSPCYMAPEQMRANGTVDARSDIWSLGVVLYELLTGELPHSGQSPLEICASILESPPKRPSAVRPEIPPAIDAIVVRCMALDPAERFESVQALAHSLSIVRGSATGRLAWMIPRGSAHQAERQPESAAVDEPVASNRRRTLDDTTTRRQTKRTLLSSVTVLVGLLVVVGLWFVRTRRTAISNATVQPTLAAPVISSPEPPATASSASVVVSVEPTGLTQVPELTGVPPSPGSNPGPRRTGKTREISTPAAENASDLPPATTAGQHSVDPVLQYGRF